jgi:hypothetical protein
VLRQKPYKVTLQEGKIWIVEGTMGGLFASAGGTAYIEIDKNTGTVLKVTHGK